MALERDRGRLNEAIALLNKYLEANQQDTDAWLELTDIYLSRQNYEKALFCYEEILSTQPNNYLVNIRYAEMLYSTANAGDNLDNLYLARKYFSHALTLIQCGGKTAPGLPRALLGLLQTCRSIDAQNKKEDEKNTLMIRTCKDRLREVYSKAATIKVEAMKIMN